MVINEILEGKRVLVVEDEETNWFLIRDILDVQRAISTWAEVGQDAIDTIRNGECFDVVLMDINLPVMDGLEVTKAIKLLQPELPIIAQTAFALDSEIEKCYQAGCIAHVLKPFTIDELIQALVKLFSD